MKGPLPPNILNKMSAEDRKPMGNLGMLTAEIEERDRNKRETKLQSNCGLLLRHMGIWYQKADMRHRTHNTPGCPDFLFAVAGRPCAVECKVAGRDLDPDQVKARDAMIQNGWNYLLCRNEEQFRDWVHTLLGSPALPSEVFKLEEQSTPHHD